MIKSHDTGWLELERVKYYSGKNTWIDAPDGTSWVSQGVDIKFWSNFRNSVNV